MVLLDGEFVGDSKITPKKHKYIGTFRESSPPNGHGADVIMCPCNQHLWTVEETFKHWQLGHFDTPQYQTIKDAGELTNG